MRTTTISTNSTPTEGVQPPVLIVLLADTPIDAVKQSRGTYHDIFTDLFKKALALAKTEDGKDRSLEVKSWDAVEGEYPDGAELDKAAGLLITGSAKSAYAPVPWISQLTAFTALIPSTHPNLKLIGVCFGHQIMAQAFGAKVEQNEKGWEVGVREIELTEMGAKVLGEDGKGTVRIHQFHKDHVTSLPPHFHLLGSTSISPVHGMIRLNPSLATYTQPSDIHTLTVQGHPEFTPDDVLKIIDSRETSGVFGKEVADPSRVFAKEHDEGVRIGRVCLAMIGV